MLVAAWDGVTTKTVLNCFRKSKISTDGQKAVIVEDNDPFKESEEEIEDPRSVQGDLVSENIDAASFTDDDDAQILAVEPPPSDAEIVAKVLETEYCQDRNELLQIIKTKQTLSLFSKGDVIVQSYVNHAARIIDQHFADKSWQTTIIDYFQGL